MKIIWSYVKKVAKRRGWFVTVLMLVFLPIEIPIIWFLYMIIQLFLFIGKIGEWMEWRIF